MEAGGMQLQAEDPSSTDILGLPVGHYSKTFFMLSWIPVVDYEKRFMFICSFKLFSGLYAVTQLHVYFFNAMKDTSSSVSASIRDSSLNQALKGKLLSVLKSSQNQTGELIPGQLAQLLGSAWNACQVVFLSRTDTGRFLKGSTLACSQNWAVMGTVQAV